MKIVYIASDGRSGSTLISRMLGELPQVFNVGEMIRFLYVHYASEQYLPCECGKPVSECTFWQTIVPLVNSKAREFASRYMHLRYIPLLTFPNRPQKIKQNADELVKNAEFIINKIKEKSDCSVIVDSSKSPTYLFAVMNLKDTDLYVLHLVKDPRNVVASWSEPKEYIGTKSHFQGARDWLLFNWLIERLARNSSTKYHFLRYEDFVQNPSVEFQKIVDWVFGMPTPVEFLKGNVATLTTPQHSLAGNPDKFDTGRIEIRSRSSPTLPLFWEWAVSILTLPFLMRYKYPFIRNKKKKLKGLQ